MGFASILLQVAKAAAAAVSGASRMLAAAPSSRLEAALPWSLLAELAGRPAGWPTGRAEGQKWKEPSFVHILSFT